jgi:hypothetical protein
MLREKRKPVNSNLQSVLKNLTLVFKSNTMKTKTIIYIAGIAISSLLFLSFNKKEEINKKYLTIRAAESSTPILSSPIIIIAHEDGKIEEFGMSTDFKKNTKTINDIINDYVVKGYKLEHFSTGLSNATILTTCLMSK